MDFAAESFVALSRQSKFDNYFMSTLIQQIASTPSTHSFKKKENFMAFLEFH